MPGQVGGERRFPAAEMQWAAAMAQEGVRPTPAFHFTLMSAGRSEAVLPLELSKGRGRLFFQAMAQTFEVAIATGLDKSQVPIDPHTIEVEGPLCRFHRPQSRGRAAQHVNENFNRGLSSSSRPVM